MALVTLQEYKDYYAISSTTGDSRISLLVDLVSDLVDNYLGRNIQLGTYTNNLEELLGTFIYLDNFPIASVTTLEYFSNTSETWVTIDAADYEVYSETGIIELIDTSITADISTKRSKAVRVTYQGGFSTIPSDLKLAVFDLITYYNKREQTPVRSFNSTNTDTSGTFSGSEMPAHIKRVLSLYRNRD